MKICRVHMAVDLEEISTMSKNVPLQYIQITKMTYGDD